MVRPRLRNRANTVRQNGRRIPNVETDTDSDDSSFTPRRTRKRCNSFISDSTSSDSSEESKSFSDEPDFCSNNSDSSDNENVWNRYKRKKKRQDRKNKKKSKRDNTTARNTRKDKKSVRKILSDSSDDSDFDSPLRKKNRTVSTRNNDTAGPSNSVNLRSRSSRSSRATNSQNRTRNRTDPSTSQARKRQRLIPSTDDSDDTNTDDSLIIQRRRRQINIPDSEESLSSDDSSIQIRTRRSYSTDPRVRSFRIVLGSSPPLSEMFDDFSDHDSDFVESSSDTSNNHIAQRPQQFRIEEVVESSDSDIVMTKRSSRKPALLEDSDCYSSDGESDKCPICLIKFVAQEVGNPDNCDHSFCAECIKQWANNSTTCPVDRKPFDSIIIRKIHGGKVIRKLHVEAREFQAAADDTPEVLEIVCTICHSSEPEENMLLCDVCDRGYHTYCLNPPLDEIPLHQWYCPDCEANPTIQNSEDSDTSMVSTGGFRTTFSLINILMSRIDQGSASGNTNTNRRSRPSQRSNTTTYRRRPRQRASNSNNLRMLNRPCNNCLHPSSAVSTIPSQDLFGTFAQLHVSEPTSDWESETGMDDEVAVMSRVRSVFSVRRQQNRKSIANILNTPRILNSMNTRRNISIDLPDPTSNPFILDNILESQSLWHSKDGQIVSKPDGSVSVVLQRKNDENPILSNSDSNTITNQNPTSGNDGYFERSFQENRNSDFNSSKKFSVPGIGHSSERLDLSNSNSSPVKNPLFPTNNSRSGNTRPMGRSFPENRNTGGNRSQHSSGVGFGRFNQFNPSTRPGFSNILENNPPVDLTPFRNTAPIRFRMNPPVKPGSRRAPPPTPQPAAVAPLTRPPTPPSFLELDSPKNDSPSADDDSIDIYGDIEHNPTPGGSSSDFDSSKRFSSLPPPPQPPALLFDSDSDDDLSGLVIDDSYHESTTSTTTVPNKSDIYDPTEPNEDTDTDEDQGNSTAKIDTMKKSEEPANTNIHSQSEEVLPIYGPHLPMPAPPALPELPTNLLENSSDEEPCPNLLLYPESTKKSNDDLDIPFPDDPKLENIPIPMPLSPPKESSTADVLEIETLVESVPTIIEDKIKPDECSSDEEESRKSSCSSVAEKRISISSSDSSSTSTDSDSSDDSDSTDEKSNRIIDDKKSSNHVTASVNATSSSVNKPPQRRILDRHMFRRKSPVQNRTPTPKPPNRFQRLRKLSRSPELSYYRHNRTDRFRTADNNNERFRTTDNERFRTTNKERFRTRIQRRSPENTRKNEISRREKEDRRTRDNTSRTATTTHRQYRKSYKNEKTETKLRDEVLSSSENEEISENLDLTNIMEGMEIIDSCEGSDISEECDKSRENQEDNEVAEIIRESSNVSEEKIVEKDVQSDTENKELMADEKTDKNESVITERMIDDVDEKPDEENEKNLDEEDSVMKKIHAIKESLDKRQDSVEQNDCKEEEERSCPEEEEGEISAATLDEQQLASAKFAESDKTPIGEMKSDGEIGVDNEIGVSVNEMNSADNTQESELITAGTAAYNRKLHFMENNEMANSFESSATAGSSRYVLQDLDPVSDTEYNDFHDSRMQKNKETPGKKKKKRKDKKIGEGSSSLMEQAGGSTANNKKRQKNSDKKKLNKRQGNNEQKSKKKSNKLKGGDKTSEKLSWKKSGKNAKERGKENPESKQGKRKKEIEKMKKKEKRKELARYDVRKIIDKPRRKVDKFGRDVSASRSPSFSPPIHIIPRSPQVLRNRSERGSGTDWSLIWRRSRSRDRKSRSHSRNRSRHSKDRYGHMPPSNRDELEMVDQHLNMVHGKRKHSLSPSSRELNEFRKHRQPMLPEHSPSRSISYDGMHMEDHRIRGVSIERVRMPEELVRIRPLLGRIGPPELPEYYYDRQQACWNSSSLPFAAGMSPSPPRHFPNVVRRSYSRSITPPSSQMALISQQPSRSKKLTVIVPNKKVSDKKHIKKNKENKRKKKKRTRSAMPSKEVFQSGDNILVSVNFSNNSEKNISSSSSKKHNKRTVSEYPTPGNHQVDPDKLAAAAEKRMRKRANMINVPQEVLNAKPVAVIDLNTSPFKEVNRSPIDVILLSDSGDDDDEVSIQTTNHSLVDVTHSPSYDQHSEYSGSPVDRNNINGPKTPPELPISFTISGGTSQTRPLMAVNPLFVNEELNDDNAEENSTPSHTSETKNNSSPKAIYDPFDPTKSRSVSPEIAKDRESSQKKDFGVFVDMFANDTTSPTRSDSGGGHSACSGTPVRDDTTIGDEDLVQNNESQISTEIIRQTPTNKNESALDTSSSSQTLNNQDTKNDDDDNDAIPVEIATKSSQELDSDVTNTPVKQVASNKTYNSPIKHLQTKLPSNLVKQPIYPDILPWKLPKSTAPPPTQPSTSSSLPPPPHMPSSSSSLISGLPLPPLNNGDDSFELDDSPYSPASSEGDDIFEPPAGGGSPVLTDAATTPVAKTSASKLPLPPSSVFSKTKPKDESTAFDSLFGSSPQRVKKRGSYSPTGSKNILKNKSKPRERVHVKGRDEKLKILDDVPNSAVELIVKEKFLKKLHRQERVVEEVKVVLKPHYAKKHINKDEYKEILRKAVPKICHNKSGDINPLKIQDLVEAYVKNIRSKKNTALPVTTNRPKKSADKNATVNTNLAPILPGIMNTNSFKRVKTSWA